MALLIKLLTHHKQYQIGTTVMSDTVTGEIVVLVLSSITVRDECDVSLHQLLNGHCIAYFLSLL